MTDRLTPAVEVGVASRPGTVLPSGDAAAAWAASTGTVAAVVVDGVGHDHGVDHLADLLAQVAARTGATRGALAGLMAAASLVADPGTDDEPRHAVAALAVVDPDHRETRVAWVGDCRAYGWDGRTLRRYSTDHTMGQWLRALRGVDVDVPPALDAGVRVTLATATVATVAEVGIPDPLVLITSDGVHDHLDHHEMVALVRTRHDAPQTLADELVDAVPDEGGWRDDATAVVLLRR